MPSAGLYLLLCFWEWGKSSEKKNEIQIYKDVKGLFGGVCLLFVCMWTCDTIVCHHYAAGWIIVCTSVFTLCDHYSSFTVWFISSLIVFGVNYHSIRVCMISVWTYNSLVMTEFIFGTDLRRDSLFLTYSSVSSYFFFMWLLFSLPYFFPSFFLSFSTLLSSSSFSSPLALLLWSSSLPFLLLLPVAVLLAEELLLMFSFPEPLLDIDPSSSLGSRL